MTMTATRRPLRAWGCITCGRSGFDTTSWRKFLTDPPTAEFFPGWGDSAPRYIKPPIEGL